MGYWGKVLKKAVSLGVYVAGKSAPKVIDAAVVTVINKCCEKIDSEFKKMFTTTLRNSLITLAINILGMIFCIVHPFNNIADKIIMYSCFSASFIFWVVRMILFWKQNGKVTVDVSKQILAQKNVYKGIESYVYQSVPVVANIYNGIDLAKYFIPSLGEVPSVSDLVKHLVKLFWKRFALFFGLVAVYTVAVYWILKPILLVKFG